MTQSPPHTLPDLDECRVRSLCQHACQNTEGSYHCLCPAGYRLLPSGKNCQGEQAAPRLGGLWVVPGALARQEGCWQLWVPDDSGVSEAQPPCW